MYVAICPKRTFTPKVVFRGVYCDRCVFSRTEIAPFQHCRRVPGDVLALEMIQNLLGKSAESPPSGLSGIAKGEQKQNQCRKPRRNQGQISGYWVLVGTFPKQIWNVALW